MFQTGGAICGGIFLCSFMSIRAPKSSLDEVDSIFLQDNVKCLWGM